MYRMKKTKIVATMSDFRCTEEFVRQLFDAGMDVVRINTAHVTEEGAARIVETVHKVNDAIPIMIDTKGPEIRVTTIADEYGNGIRFAAGDRIAVRGSKGEDLTTRKVVYMNVETIVEDIPVGARMLIADGEMEIRVVEKSETELVCEFTTGGLMRSRKSVNVPGVSIGLPSVTEKDRRFIEWAVAHDVDFIAHSFVRNARDIQAVQDILDAHGSPIKIISKIENQEGLDNIDEIIEKSYGIMVARGDLGVELLAEAIPNAQRRIVEKCIAAKRPVIIATQMLHTMIEHPRPTRAEISDVANAIYQRVDAVMLSGETANGLYPVEAVATMARVAREIENDEVNNGPNIDMNLVRINNEITAQLARSAVRASINLRVKAIVIDTLSGRTGRYVAAFRGQMPVYAVCYRKSTMRQLALSYGVHAIYCEPSVSREGFLLNILYYLEDRKWLSKEDLIVVLGGSFGAATGASFLEIGNVLNLEHKALSQYNAYRKD